MVWEGKGGEVFACNNVAASPRTGWNILGWTAGCMYMYANGKFEE